MDKPKNKYLEIGKYIENPLNKLIYIKNNWGINDGEVVVRRLELPQSNVDGDTTLALCLKVVKHPSVLEGTLSELSGLLLELCGVRVNTGDSM